MKHTFVRYCSKHACTTITCGAGGLNSGLGLDQCSFFMSASSQNSGETVQSLARFFASRI